jgi:SAM-dependent methyltransferase
VPIPDRSYTNRVRAESFGIDAETYDRARPGYPRGLIDDLVADAPRRALDVGCGTGRAGRLLVERGVDVLGLEIDERMAAVARGHGVPVEVGAFETWDAAQRTFDLVISGQAWHWIDPVVGAAQAAAVLAPGGRLALFWNFAALTGAARRAVDAAYDEAAPELTETSVMRGGGPRTVPAHVAGLRQSGRFREIESRRYSWTQRYGRDEWLALVRTHSDHSTLPAGRLDALLDAIGAAFDSIGGEATAEYTTEAVFARAP